MFLTDSAGAVNTVGAVCGALLALSAVALIVYKAVRWFDRLQEIMVRSEAKADVTVAAVTPNGGKSLADAVDHLKQQMNDVVANQETGRQVIEYLMPRIEEIGTRLAALEKKAVVVSVTHAEESP